MAEIECSFTRFLFVFGDLWEFFEKIGRISELNESLEETPTRVLTRLVVIEDALDSAAEKAHENLQMFGFVLQNVSEN